MGLMDMQQWVKEIGGIWMHYGSMSLIKVLVTMIIL